VNAQTASLAADTNETAPSFQFVTLRGDTIEYGTLQGKVIILDFWSSNCNPCIKSMPQMERFYQKYKNDHRVAIYLVNSGWESIAEARIFTERKRKNFLFFSYGEKYDLPFAYDDKSVTMKKYNLNSNPSTIIIDSHFTIRARHSGYIQDFYKFLNEHVERLLTDMMHPQDGGSR
jgi:thiol-disulfide isomerase/thioredoxin